MQSSCSMWNRSSRPNASPSSCPVSKRLRLGLLIPLILLLARASGSRALCSSIIEPRSPTVFCLPSSYVVYHENKQS